LRTSIEFYRETDFKQTPIGKIPKGWRIVKVEDVGKVITGTTPSTQVKDYWNGQYPFVTPTDFSETKYVYKTARKVSEKGIKKNKLIPKDAVLVVCIGSTIGKIAMSFTECITNQQINAILCGNNVNPHYVYYAMSFRRSVIRAYAGITAKPIIKKSLFEKLLLPLPSIGEQQKIAEVLSTVGKIKEKVDEIITKTERLKKGLMQELLTKGIGHKEFKDTEIGRIPEDWEVVKLRGVAEIRRNKSISEFENVAFIPMELISESEIFARYEVRPMKEVKSFTYCECGDLLLAKITPCLENGKQGIVPNDVPHGFALATTEVFPMSCKNIHTLFLYYILKFSKFRNKIIASMTGTTGRQRASKRSVETLVIPRPPSSEQQKIAEILSSVDKKLKIERNEKARLERIKQALMDLLLTGKIRVRV